jgi:putative addiction module killer protein
MIKIKITSEFNRWLKSLCDKEKGQIFARLHNIKKFSHFGDAKYLGEGLAELRWKNGRRIYFYRENKKAIVLIIGGTKNEQKKNIKKARLFLRKYAYKKN